VPSIGGRGIIHRVGIPGKKKKIGRYLCLNTRKEVHLFTILFEARANEEEKGRCELKLEETQALSKRFGSNTRRGKRSLFSSGEGELISQIKVLSGE